MGAFSRLDQRAILGPVYQDVKGEAEAMQGKPHIWQKPLALHGSPSRCVDMRLMRSAPTGLLTCAAGMIHDIAANVAYSPVQQA